MSSTLAAVAGPLAPDQVARFHEQGFHVLPAFLDSEVIARLKAEVDRCLADRKAPFDPYATGPQATRRMEIEYREHGLLLTEPRLMAMLRQLMDGREFSFHHLHTARHDPGCGGVSWHHDYEQCPQANRAHLMVHVFYYLNGLDGTVGDLLLMPGSHQRVMERDAFNLFGTADLPGSLAIDDVPPGTAVIVHSAVQHARRPKPGGEGRPRYFLDASYCQDGVQWPGYPNMQRMLARAKELGLGRGEFDFVFDERRFFASDEARKKLHAVNRGSLVQRLA